MTWRIITGDCRDVLRSLPAGSAHTVCTSPPYFGLRDYGAEGQIGLEPTPDEFVAALVAVFREVRRVLRDDGTVWLNLGDSYAAGTAVRSLGRNDAGRNLTGGGGNREGSGNPGKQGTHVASDGCKPKDLLGIPWMVAFALRADGWVLRQEIVWQKPNPMPESVTDRCTKSHEQIFMFSKASWSGPEPGEFAHISDEDARWLALFFDAEGSLVLRREADGARHAAQISLGSTCRPLLEAAQRIVGAGNILERPGQNAPMHYWQLSNKRARDLLLRLYPHLIVKRQQARCLIDLESRKWHRGDNRKGLGAAEIAYRERLWSAVKSLNSFGSPDLSWVPEPKIGRWGAGPRYFYDADAIREEQSEWTKKALEGNWQRKADAKEANAQGSAWRENGHNYAQGLNPAGRNKRSVWTVATQPYAGAHFATFPPKLIEPCILAGAPERACGKCGAPWVRVVERTPAIVRPSERRQVMLEQQGGLARTNLAGTMTQAPSSRTVGFEPSCPHGDGSAAGVVLDPFAGAGTTGMVALRHGRSFVGIELNPQYAEMARWRIRDDAPLLNQPGEMVA